MRATAAIVLVLLAAWVTLQFADGEAGNVEVAGTPRAQDTDVYEVRPGKAIGPVEIGMSRGDARQAMKATGHAVESFVRWPRNSPPVLAMQENAFQVYFDASGRVEEIEVMGPSGDWQHAGQGPAFSARFGDVDVFRTPASKLVEVVSAKAPPDTSAEDHGVAFAFPSIGISLWRERSEDTPFFETVLVHRSKRSS